MSFRANSINFRLAVAFAALYVFFTAQHATHSNAEDIPAKNILSERLVAEEAAFELYSGNGLGASILAAKDDNPSLTPLKALSDIKLARTAAPVMSYADPDLASEALSAMFLSNNIAALKVSTGGAQNQVAAYYGALAAYAEGDLKTSSRLIQSVDSSSPLHPYALILLAQIQVKYNYPGGALSILNVVITRGPDKHDEATDLSRMYKGYLLYELGRYAEAEEAFRSVTYRPFAKEALANAAHAALRASRCKNALEYLRGIEPLNPLAASGQELLLAKAHCLKETGKTGAALEVVTETIKTLNALTDGYDRVYASKALPHEADELLLTTMMASKDALFDPGKIDGRAVTESIRIEAALKDSKKLKKAAAYYNAATETERAFAKRITEIDYAIHTVSARRASLETWFKGNRSGAASARARLQYLKDTAYEQSADGPVLREHSLGGAVTAEIEKRWSSALSRPLSGSEKLLIHLILLDGAKGKDYLDNIQYSQLLYLMTIPPSSKRKTPTADRIADDLYTLANERPLPKELYISTTEEWITKKLTSDTRKLRELKALKDIAERDLKDISTVKKTAVTAAKEILIRRALLMHFEVRSINEKARSVLDSFSGKQEAGK